WDAIDGLDPKSNSLAEEAIFLGRLVVSLVPDEPEPMGLLALMLHCESREPARRGPRGEFIPLGEQDTGQWNRNLLIEAETLLSSAAQKSRMGRFQTEAAMQSLHAQSKLTASAHPEALARLYDLLCEQTDAIGAWVSRAAAHAELHGADRGLELLTAIPEVQVESYQPYWAARAHLERTVGLDDRAARARAIELSRDPAIREFLSLGHASAKDDTEAHRGDAYDVLNQDVD
ncbi:MAG: DUF6596 domain-containing protein, partial [Myxococcota bacterium]